MNIFIDTNILFKDPFLQRGKLVVLKELAKTEEVTLFVSRAVLSEVRRGYKEYIGENLKYFDQSAKQLNKYISTDEDKISSTKSIEEFLAFFDSQILDMEQQSIIKVVEYLPDTMQNIVELDMHPAEPFYKSVQHKEGIVTPKMALRDAIIWYSYINFLKLEEIENNFFLSHNTKEFAKDHNLAQSKTELAYELHDNLYNQYFMSAHKSVDNFIDTYEEEIQEIFRINEVDILTPKSIERISISFKNEGINKIIGESLISVIEEELNRDISNLEPPSFQGTRFTGHLEEDGYDGEYYEEINVQEVSSFGGTLIVEVAIKYMKSVEIYAYNSYRDIGEDRYTLVGEDSLLYDLNATISWEIEDYIKILSAKNIDILDVIDLSNPDTDSMELKILSRKFVGEFGNPPEIDDGLDLEYEF